MSIESYKKEQIKIEKEEAKKANGGVEVEEKESLSLTAIFADKEQSALFGKMVESIGDPMDTDIMSRFTKGKLDGNDIDRLEDLRKDFEDRMNKAEDLKKEITPELAVEMAKNNKDFEKLINMLEPERVVEMIQDRLGELAASDPSGFKKISDEIEQMNAFKKGDLKDLDDSIKKLSEEKKIDEDEYMKALALKDDAEREREIAKLVRYSWGDNFFGRVRRVTDFVLGGSLNSKGTQELLSKKAEFENILLELDNHKKKIGGALSVTIKNNEDMMKALSKALIGEKTKVETFGMKQSKESLPKKEQIVDGWKAYNKANNITSAKWRSMSDAEKDDERTKFADKMKADELAKCKSFWQKLFHAIFCAFLDKEVQELN